MKSIKEILMFAKTFFLQQKKYCLPLLREQDLVQENLHL